MFPNVYTWHIWVSVQLLLILIQTKYKSVSGNRIMDSTRTLEYAFRCRNVKKAAILDPDDKKNQVLDIVSIILKIFF